MSVVEKPVGPESEEDYLAARWEALEAVEGQGRIKAYPHYSSSSSATQGRALSIEEFVQKFNHLKPAERLDNPDVEVTGTQPPCYCPVSHALIHTLSRAHNFKTRIWQEDPLLRYPQS